MDEPGYSSISSDQLILVCVSGAATEAWQEFVRRFHRLIATVVLRTAQRWGEVSYEVIDDLVQETYLKLCADDCRLLREFEPRYSGSFLGYLKVITANTAHDYFKAAHSGKRGAGRPNEDLSAQLSDILPAPNAPQGLERDILLREVDELLSIHACGPNVERDRTIFWLYYQQGLSARGIASLPWVALTTKGVESVILRLTRLVRSEMAAARVLIGQGNTPEEKGV